MTGLQKLGALSYSMKGIALGCAIILLVGGALTGMASLFEQPGPSPTRPPDVISDIYTRFIYHDYGDLWEITGIEDQMPRGLESLFVGPEENWLPELNARSEAATPDRGISFALGLWKRKHQHLTEALALFHQENEHYPHALVRSLELETALMHPDPAVVEQLVSDPVYENEMDNDFHIQWGVETQNWMKIITYVARSQIETKRPVPVVVSLVAGCIWSILLLSLLPRKPSAAFCFLSLAAIGLGAVSTLPTVLSGMWLDALLGLSRGTDFFSELVYMVVSVGVREEIWKVLLYTPLLVFTARRGRDLEALLLGAFVGLGFAVEENIGYIMTDQSGVAVSRFVSANMLHFMLTGATALALTRAVRDPKQWGVDALQVLVFAIGLHGLYNTLLSQPVPGLGDMSYFHGAALVGCATLFFREVDGLTRLQGVTVSRTGLFCWGVCLLFCLELAVATPLFGFNDALAITGQAALASVFTGYIFVHFVREPLSP